jgi:hypothetical protein
MIRIVGVVWTEGKSSSVVRLVMNDWSWVSEISIGWGLSRKIGMMIRWER